jgi:hypothetical protein
VTPSLHSWPAPLQALTLVANPRLRLPETANSPTTLQHVVLYIGAILAEYFMYHKQHTLIIYDDLSKQA